MMRAAVLKQFGSADQLEVGDVPVPTPRCDEVLIEVAAAGVLYADIVLRRGTYLRFRYDLPAVPGHEAVGTISEFGEQVEGLTPGMRVCAELVSGGAYAEFATAPARRVIPIPDGVSFEHALVYSFNLPAAYLVYYKFVSIPTEATVLVHSGAGGFGSMLTRIAKRAGNRVIALVSSENKRDACLSYGADHVIDTSKSGYVAETLRLTEQRGVDVIFNHRGGSTLGTDLEVLAFRGKWIFTNLLDEFRGTDISLLNQLSNKCPTIVYASSATLFGTDEHREALHFLQEWLRTEELESPTRTYSLEESPDAHRWLESGQSVGKLAIHPKARHEHAE